MDDKATDQVNQFFRRLHLAVAYGKPSSLTWQQIFTAWRLTYPNMAKAAV
jgi:hypothetical protein